MTMWIKQSTAITVKLGPFVDDADGKTVEDSLTISQADIRLSKNGGDLAQTNNSAGATHDERGYYDVPLDTTDTNTLGRLKVLVSESGALPVWADFMVVPANVWDSLFGADKLQVHVDEMTAGIITSTVIATDAIDADALAADAIAEINATVDTAISDAALATAANLATLAGYVDTEVAAIKAKTDNLPTDPADASDISAAFTVIANAIAALNNVSVSSILTTAMTESYPTANATMSLAQALYSIHQFLTEKVVSGTGVTVKERDQSTTAKTYTLNDADEPTSITENT